LLALITLRVTTRAARLVWEMAARVIATAGVEGSFCCWPASGSTPW